MTKQMELPETFTTTLYVYVGTANWNWGQIHVRDFKAAEGIDPSRVLIREVPDVSFKIDPDFDVCGGVVESLKEEKARILAEAEVKARAVQDRIDNLLAITHEAAE